MAWGAENNSAAGAGSGNASGSSAVYTELWSIEDSDFDKTSILVMPLDYRTGLRYVSPIWQYAALVVMLLAGFSTTFEHVTSMEAGSTLMGTQWALHSKWLPLLRLGCGGVLGAVGYYSLPGFTKHMLMIKNLDSEACDAHTSDTIKKRTLRHFCMSVPVISFCQFAEELMSNHSVNLVSKAGFEILIRRFVFPTAFFAVVHRLQISYGTIMALRRLMILIGIPMFSILQVYRPYRMGWWVVFRWQFNCTLLQTSLITHLQEAVFILALIFGADAPDAMDHLVAYTVGLLVVTARVKWTLLPERAHTNDTI